MARGGRRGIVRPLSRPAGEGVHPVTGEGDHCMSMGGARRCLKGNVIRDRTQEFFMVCQDQPQ